MPIEPVKIPQNVYIEDHIVGPLTLRQIIISMLGIGLSYAIWASISKVYSYVPLHITVIVWIPAALALIFAFVRINDLSMAHILVLLVERLNKPQTRVYGPRRGLAVNARAFTPPSASTHQKVAAKSGPGNDIDALSSFLDTGGTDTPDEGDSQGSSIPRRPVQPGRITVSPLLQEDLEDVEGPEGQSLMRDIVHPPHNHA